MRRMLSVCTLFLLTAAAVGADPVTVPAGRFADLKAPAPKGSSVVWRVYPPPVQRAPDLPPGRLIFAGKAGTTYVVTAITIDFAKQTVTEADTEVTFGGKTTPDPDPSPNPKPKPDPEPKPAPVTGTLFLVVVEETSRRTTETAWLLGDLTFWNGLAGRDVVWRLYDKDSPDAARLGYLPHANKVGLPALLLMDKAGKVVDARRLPAKAADVDAVLKEVGR